MALPYTRNRTYAPDSQVSSVDLNALQDAVVEGWHGNFTTILHAGDLVPSSPQTPHWLLLESADNLYLQSNNVAGAKAIIPIRLASGALLKSLKVWASHEDASNLFTLKILLKDLSTGAVTQLGSTSTATSSTAIQPLEVVVPGAGQIVEAGFILYGLIAAADAANFDTIVHGAEYVSARE